MLDFGDILDPNINRWVQRTARFVRQARINGVWGVVPAFTTLLIEFDPRQTSFSEITGHLQAMAQMEEVEERSRLFEIPVCYGAELGPDIDDVARQTGLTVEGVIDAHTGRIYRIYCIGFSPGFPLCGILPESLRVERRQSPRTVVPAGSVATAGVQTGVYPVESPGGWNLLGRTPASLFCLHATPPILYKPGDSMRFRAISRGEYDELENQVKKAGILCGRFPMPRISVVKGGLQTTIQDAGRRGYEHLGIMVGGWLDDYAARWANRLLAQDSLPLLEITLLGPELRALDAGWVSLAGANLTASINGMPWKPGTTWHLQAGDVVRFGTVRSGARAYLAASGGFFGEEILGSRSTDLVAGFGGSKGRVLKAGDTLEYGGGEAQWCRASVSTLVPTGVIRVLLGELDRGVSPDIIRRFLAGTFVVSSRSNRIGIRLDGPEPLYYHGSQLASNGPSDLYPKRG